jgi:hypothetical protein
MVHTIPSLTFALWIMPISQHIISFARSISVPFSHTWLDMGILLPKHIIHVASATRVHLSMRQSVIRSVLQLNAGHLGWLVQRLVRHLKYILLV